MYFHIFFYLHVFPENINNVTRTMLPNGSLVVRIVVIVRYSNLRQNLM